MRVPLPVSPCRGAEPSLTLEYDSGNGNGPFGMGWAVSVPHITRRSDKGLPRYADATESDTFILSSQEDLVPELTPEGGGYVRSTTTDGEYRVDAYRPRVEGLFARIERRTHLQSGDTHWRTITAENVTSIFGLTPSARLANPKNPQQIYRWLLEATFDALGHVTLYEYKAEDLAGVAVDDASEAARHAEPPANTYLKRVHYGNRTPLETRSPSDSELRALSWLFEIVFDYGEHATDVPDEVQPWMLRADPFSTFRAGFDVRTYRLCRRVLLFHEMPEQLSAPARLVYATELSYDESPRVTYLTSVRGVGYAWDATNQVTSDTTPTLRLDYTRVGTLASQVQVADTPSLAQAPAGIDGDRYQMVDLDGEGVAGILTACASPAPALYYKRNLGGGAFAAAERLPLQPSSTSLAGEAQLVSLNADGRIDVATFYGPTPGYYERTRGFAWAPFSAFRSVPNLDWRARGVHLLDVDGDGLTDVLLAEDDVFVWYPSLARDGFGAPARVNRSHDEQRGAVALTTDDYETIFVADMTGDGLSDLVRIRNGEVCYWPNLGYGRFGAKITMKGAPQFDAPDLFDPRRLRLGDIGGTGVTDIVYLSRRGASVYLNRAGNGWDPGVVIPLPVADAFATVRIADFLGTGTACLVWSSTAPADAGSPLRYVDLLGSTKPHLLRSVTNGMGAQTTITYAPSTQFYLEDRRAGRPWATRLGMVVQTVAQVETRDAVAGTRFVFRYRYAHGFFDAVEREFRGFARVDTWDAEFVSSDHGAGTPPQGIEVEGGEYVLPPVHTITWFHTGAWNGEQDDLHAALRREFYAGDPAASLLAATAIPGTLTTPALREADRALKGRRLREEVYAEDGTALAREPYGVTDYRYEVRELQPIAAQRHGVYHSFERERLVYHYERRANDPRIEHELALEVDPLGHVVRQAHVAYARRSPAEPEQGQVLATCGAITFAAPIDSANDFRHGVVTASDRYELALAPTSMPLAFDAIDGAMTGAAVVPFDATLAAGTMRTIQRVRHQYWADDLSAPLPLGSVQTRALAYDHFELAFPATQLQATFGASVTAVDLLAAGYVSPDGDYWTHAGVTTYAPASFWQPASFTDPFGNTSRVVYDPLQLLIVEEHTSNDPAFDNVTTATVDYRVLAASMVTDPNGNQSAARFDELGRIVAVALMGRAGAGEGDTLADPTTTIEYHQRAWEAVPPSPAHVRTRHRLQHGASNPGWFETVTYSDGLGHEVLQKTQAEPDGNGQARWAGTGRTVFDNKGNPTKKYEPYFAGDPGYDSEPSLVMAGYTPLLRYDPLSRLVRVDLPDGTFTTTEFDAWQESRADATDNVLESAWYADARSRPASDPLRRAATLAAQHAHTPTLRVADALGRTFLVVADAGPAGKVSTRTELDIQGNPLAITDALGHVTVQQTFDAMGRCLQSVSLDAGTSRSLHDGTGHALRAWDPRGFAHRTVYDALHRMTHVWVTPPGGTEFLAERLVYGEGLSQAQFRGHEYLHFDGAGVEVRAAYDFEGRVTTRTRQMAAMYQSTPAWDALGALTDPTSFLPAATGLLESETFDTTTVYDAMGRIVTTTTPDQSVVVFTYNEATYVRAISVYIRGSSTLSPVVTAVDYNARGQRVRVAHGQGVVTDYTYDHRVHLLTRIRTVRSSDGSKLQDLFYTFDPVHNVVQVDDLAQQTVYFAGNVTNGTQTFEYDPLYRLTSASGREQPGQVGYALGPNGYPEAPFSSIPHRNDLQALVAYTEQYAYDAVGNLLSTVHTAAGGGWTRTQTYDSGSNRLATVSLPGDPSAGPYSGVFSHDAAGNLLALPKVASISWDHAGRLTSANLMGGGIAYFTYDAHGQRVRKIVERQGQITERVYDGAYERHRERSGSSLPQSTLASEHQTLHLSDGDRRFALAETTVVGPQVPPGGPASVLRFQFSNHLGSACVETDAAGGAVSYEEYYPYGGSSFRAGSQYKRHRFSGKERDVELGLYYHGARYYAPWLGRWTSCDPRGLGNGTHLYAAFLNNPLRFIDPDGKQDRPHHGRPPAHPHPRTNRRPSSPTPSHPTHRPTHRTTHPVHTPPRRTTPPRTPPPTTPPTPVAGRMGTPLGPPTGTSPYVRLHATFDGKNFVLTGTRRDGSTVEVYRTDSAQSGRPISVSAGDAARFGGSTSDSYLNNPRYVGARDNGPIPEGTYRFDPSRFVQFSTTEQLTILTSGGTDPFGKAIHMGDWGAGRVELNPVRIQPTPYGTDPTAPSRRSGFYLHGGVIPGSSGCIDIGNSGVNAVASALAGYHGDVTIDVHYTQAAPTVGAASRALGRFTYPPQANPTLWDRIQNAWSGDSQPQPGQH